MGLGLKRRFFGYMDSLRRGLLSQGKVFLYHRVTDVSFDKAYLCVPPDDFEVHVRLLKKHFHVLPLGELLERVRHGDSKGCAAVTFDDGFADNAREAAVILKKYEMPATFFVSTGEVDTDREIWVSDLERLFYDASVDFTGFQIEFPQEKVMASDRDDAYHQVFNLFLSLSPKDRERNRLFLNDSLRNHHKARSTHRMMSKEELIRLAGDKLFDIGAHTVFHSRLSLLSEEDQREEIVRSKDQIEEWTQKQVKFFAYPFGQVTDYNSQSIRLCQEAGFIGALSAFPGFFDRLTSSFEIPRFNMRRGSEGVIYK